MEMLIYEGIVERIERRGADGTKESFWSKIPNIDNLDWFSTTPCGICPVSKASE
jgi:hypothetical protein